MAPRQRPARRAAIAALAVSTAAGLGLAAAPAVGADDSASGASDRGPALGQPARERMGDYDARVGSLKAQLRDARAAVSRRAPSFNAYAKSLGDQAVVDFDATTGTPRNVGRTDGFLTGPSAAKPAAVAMRYVRDHLGVLGLTRADLSTFRLARQHTDASGLHHLAWTQSARGIPVFGNGLEAHLTARGQLISLQGAPISGLRGMAADADTSPRMTASQARAAAAGDVGGTPAASAVQTRAKSGAVSWANHDYAKPVWMLTKAGLRLGWSTYVQAGGDDLNYQHVIDTTTGQVLYRHDTVDYDKGDALVFENYPGAPKGGKQVVVNLIKRGYLPKQAKNLAGDSVIAWADVNDDDKQNPSERVAVPGTKKGAQYPFTPFPGAYNGSLCAKAYKCSWNHTKADSWRKNLKADVTQGFYFDNLFGDYLAKKPIGFTPAAGAFKGDDPVLLNALDGANTDNGLPDGDHINNANMSTPPDGIPPTMQMYLFSLPGAWLDTSSAFDPGIIFHEYTHGLSNRLVVDATGNSTLNSVQAGSMGEAWSDFYSQDYLVARGLEKDTAKPGEILMTEYTNAGVDSQVLRTMPLDCPVDTKSPKCSDLFGGKGGYTYGDFSGVIGVPEVHASGEIWAQTLWDVRQALGHRVTAALVTRGMQLSPNDPSFLDMRNAILQADNAVYGGNHRKALWKLFANRGMGFFAGTLDSADGRPDEDFSVPPSPDAPRGTVSGQVVDGVTGAPIANALVTISGHSSGYTGDYSAVTDTSGRYVIPSVLSGTYPSIVVFGPGYEVVEQEVTVTGNGATVDFEPRRDWAAADAGGAIIDFNGPDFTPFGCGPGAAIDLNQGSGWGSTTGDDDGTPTNTMIPKFIEIELPQPIDVTAVSVDPSHTCGDPGSSSTGDYRIETSTDGVDWDLFEQGTFTAANRYQYNEITAPSPVEGVTRVRFWMLSPQVPDFATNCPEGAYGGCQYTDMSEIEVFGSQPGT